MYGYFNLKDVCLTNGERRVFSSYYCRLCYCLWNKGGQVARYLTTYDATVYNLILTIAGFDEQPEYLNCERIKTNNKKHFKDDEMGNLIADLGIIAFAIKVRDNIEDGDKFKAFIGNFFFGRLFKRTVEQYKDLYDREYADIRELDELQKRNASVEEVLECYGKSMENAFVYFFDLEQKHRTLIRLLARWTLLVDMLDDYEDDYKTGANNSFKSPGCKTIGELMEQRYYEIVPFIRAECDRLSAAVQDVACGKPEWYVLDKIVSHALATVIPGILKGEDVRYHYFRDTMSTWTRMKRNLSAHKRYEKNSVHH